MSEALRQRVASWAANHQASSSDRLHDAKVLMDNLLMTIGIYERANEMRIKRIDELEAKLEAARKWEDIEAKRYNEVVAERDALFNLLGELGYKVYPTEEGLRWTQYKST